LTLDVNLRVQDREHLLRSWKEKDDLALGFAAGKINWIGITLFNGTTLDHSDWQ